MNSVLPYEAGEGRLVCRGESCWRAMGGGEPLPLFLDFFTDLVAGIS
jgi:hypothetical protein